MDPVGLLDLPVEVLTAIQTLARNFTTQRLVCSRLNQVGSKLLLDRTIKALRAEIDVCIKSVSHRVEQGGDRMEASRLQQMLDDVETLNRLTGELDGVGRTIDEKSQSLSALMQDRSNMSERSRATLLKLCDLHPEFLSVSAVRFRVAEIAARSGISSQKRLAEEPWRHDPLRVGPPRGGNPLRAGPPYRPVPNPFPNNPYGDPRYPDFGAEPDPDHMQPPPFGDDDDRDIQPFPVYPGQPFPGMPYPGGGGVGGRPGFDPQAPPGFNPDFERDRNPLGMPPRGGFRGMPPPGPFNPGGGGRPGGGGFGGPRYL